jgi:2-keto-4-pentenoate hydratase
VNDAEVRSLVESLVRAGERRVPIVAPADLASRCTRAEAQALQRVHQERVLERLGGEVIGIKLGGTTEAALQTLGLRAPFVGPIFSARTHASRAVLSRSDFMACIVEAEIGVRLGRDLEADPRVRSREELTAAIDVAFPAIEVADSRLANWSSTCAEAIVADLGYAGAWVRGAPCPTWRAIDFVALAVTLTQDGEVVRTGAGSVALGDPLRALALAVAELGLQGRALRAGDVVSTGSCTVPLPSPGGGRFVADFGALGSVVVELR